VPAAEKTRWVIVSCSVYIYVIGAAWVGDSATLNLNTNLAFAVWPEKKTTKTVIEEAPLLRLFPTTDRVENTQVCYGVCTLLLGCM